jgi:hypothetical protein
VGCLYKAVNYNAVRYIHWSIPLEYSTGVFH